IFASITHRSTPMILVICQVTKFLTCCPAKHILNILVITPEHPETANWLNQAFAWRNESSIAFGHSFFKGIILNNPDEFAFIISGQNPNLLNWLKPEHFAALEGLLRNENLPCNRCWENIRGCGWAFSRAGCRC